MIVDMDGLTRQFGNIVEQHLCMAAFLHKFDTTKRPHTYNSSIADVATPTKLTPSDAAQLVFLPILSTSFITACTTVSDPCDNKTIIFINQSTTSH